MGTKPQPLPGGPLSVNVILDGSGNGQVSLGPQRAREHWQVSSIGVKVATNVKEALCSAYVGSFGALQSQFFGSSFTGSTGDTCNIDEDLQPGQLVTAVWTGGDAGANATMTVYGTYTIGAPS